MKTFKTIYLGGLMALCLLSTTSCNDYLDVTPPSDVSPEKYFTTADQLGAYTINLYCSYKNWNAEDDATGGQFPTHADYTSFIHDDMGTDNETAKSTNARFYEGSTFKVGATGGKWNFNNINNINFFINTAEPKLDKGEVAGDETAAKHYLGEGYFLRAQEYFFRLRKLGDFPIIKECLPDDRATLIEASKRQPRNKVARFILEDLDKAASLLTNNKLGRNRISKDVALLLKARVALYEATFEKYHAGSPRVPDASAGWPGANMDYNKNFTYDNASEVKFFLQQALDASKLVADAHPQLAQNSFEEIGETNKMGSNEYYDMFACDDPSAIDEVLMYRSYIRTLAGGHSLTQWMAQSDRGYTQEFANCFLMQNGLPVYATGSGYAGDDYVQDTKVGRDWRWKLFMKAPNEYIFSNTKDQVPNPPRVYSSSMKFRCSTGYMKSKAFSKNGLDNGTNKDETASIIFRASEAYLIYLEAAWEMYGDALDVAAWKYWKALRSRAGIDVDPQVTIDATDLDKEETTSHDFALYSAGSRITSKVLYNIRRERRCELISEGFRMDDLIRWRSLDQLAKHSYFLHGCKIFGPMQSLYKASNLKYDQADDSKNNVSSPDDTKGALNGDARYLSMFRTSKNGEFYNAGMTWRQAHYLYPIAVNHFLESSKDGATIETSTIYQNPGYSTVADTPAEKDK